ncbi:MAG: ACT domain-containing protein [Pseudomonadota bacterium]
MTPGSVRDLRAMIASMAPVLSERAWSFQAIVDDAFIPPTAFAVVREEEGMTCILPAQAAGSDTPQFAKITLSVHSDLEAVGLTSAVSTALATSGIACNVIAGLHHDHLFVPWDLRDDALSLLERLSKDAHR